MIGKILIFLACYLSMCIILEFCFSVKMGFCSPLLSNFFNLKKRLKNFLVMGLVFLITLISGMWLFEFSWWSGLILGFIGWTIIAFILSDKRELIIDIQFLLSDIHDYFERRRLYQRFR